MVDDIWSGIKAVNPDPIFTMVERFKSDPHPDKVPLVIGIYRDDDMQPYVFPVVTKAEHLLLNEHADKEYQPIAGNTDFVIGAKKLLFGHNANLDKIVTCQSLSGTGSLYVGSLFIHKYNPGIKLLLPDPTWIIHNSIFAGAGLTNQGEYLYYDPMIKDFNIKNMVKSLATAEEGSVILLHGCAQNPTGVDPTKEQWKEILKICQQKRLIPFFDLAYQGFASGDFDEDAYSIRLFYESGMQFIVAQRFAVIAGVYGELVGALHVVCKDPEQANVVGKNVEEIIKSMYYHSPLHGALVLGRIMKDKALFNDWKEQLQLISGRITSMRLALRTEIELLKTPGDWSHLTTQKGMFSYTGLTEQQCQRLIDKHHVYLLHSGRITLSGVNTKNVKYIAKSFNEVVNALP